MVAVHKELEDAPVRVDGLTVQLQAAETEHTKVEEAAKASAEGIAADLGQLQLSSTVRVQAFIFLSSLFVFVRWSSFRRVHACFFTRRLCKT